MPKTSAASFLLYMHDQRHFAHLVPKNRASVGGLKQPHLAGYCAGRRAFFVAKKFASDELFSKSTAVEGNKGLVATRTQMVQCKGHKCLAGAVVALDEHIADRRGFNNSRLNKPASKTAKHVSRLPEMPQA